MSAQNLVLGGLASPLAHAFEEPAHLLLTAGLASVRGLVSVSLLPVFSSGTVPGLARLALVMAVTVPVTWSQLQHPFVPDLSALALLAFFAKEAALGVLVGLGFAVFMSSLLVIGELIDHQSGLTFSQNIDRVHGNSVSITSQFLERILFAALLLAGLMHGLVDALYLSHELWPVGSQWPSVQRSQLLSLASQTGRIFAFAVLLSGPVVLVLLVVDAAMGLLNRSAPQLNIFQLTLSVKSTIAAGVLMLALPMMMQRAVEVLPEVAVGLQVLLRQLHSHE